MPLLGYALGALIIYLISKAVVKDIRGLGYDWEKTEQQKKLAAANYRQTLGEQDRADSLRFSEQQREEETRRQIQRTRGKQGRTEEQRILRDRMESTERPYRIDEDGRTIPIAPREPEQEEYTDPFAEMSADPSDLQSRG